MTAKEMQLEFIKTYLKPTLKLHGYKVNGQTFAKDKGDFFIIINLQNYSWNSKDCVDFCFNMGIGLTKYIKNVKKVTHFDLMVPSREGTYLIKRDREFRTNTGYEIKSDSDYANFVLELKEDFENELLPFFESLTTIHAVINYYGNWPFWGERLKTLYERSIL